MRAYLIGREPPLGYTYVTEPPYDAVVIGSLSLGQLLCFQQEEALNALAEGRPVVLYSPGLPEIPKNRALAARAASCKRELKSYGIQFTEGRQKKLITAQEARILRQTGRDPGPGAVLTPLAKEILEGSD